MMKAIRWALAFVLALAGALAQAQGFDTTHAAWDALLKKHVTPIANGNASQVSYAGFKADRAELKKYLDSVSALSEDEFKKWNKNDRLAFLINAYNALTIEKILTRYPNIKSIRDFGNVIGNPWKDKFFTLFGREMSLDNIEHDTIRAPGAYDDPRIHVAVVCASIGCPMLRSEAFVGAKLEAQLEDGMRRFLSDRSRNRYNADKNELEVSKIFDWYGKDFEKGHKGFSSVAATLAKYADRLADKPEQQAAIKEGKLKISFLEYDWALNDKK